jgi:hypothetical protein
MLHFAQFGVIRECVFVNRIYSSDLELCVLFSLYSTIIESQYKAIRMSWKTGLSTELQICFVKGPKFFCVQTRFISEVSYSLYPTCFLVLTSYIIHSNNIRTVTFWFPAARLLASHRGPNREHLTEMWHLLTVRASQRINFVQISKNFRLIFLWT